MALTATVETSFGEDRKLYIRLNNFDQIANHDVPAIARFRGFLSKEAFDKGAQFVWERKVRFDADVSQPLWEQAYNALKSELNEESVALDNTD